LKENKCPNEVQCEKNKLHIKYIVGIASGVSLGSLVLSGYSNTAFVSQFSFASTVTSIVLSVVAIWMSISGERATNEIKDKIIDASDRLEKTTSNVEQINSSYHQEVSDQISSLEYIQKKLDEIVGGFTDVKDEMSLTKDQVAQVASKIDNYNFEGKKDIISYDQVVSIYEISMQLWRKKEYKNYEISIFIAIFDKFGEAMKKDSGFGYNEYKKVANELQAKDIDTHIETMYSRSYLIVKLLNKNDYSKFIIRLKELQNELLS